MQSIISLDLIGSLGSPSADCMLCWLYVHVQESHSNTLRRGNRACPGVPFQYLEKRGWCMPMSPIPIPWEEGIVHVQESHSKTWRGRDTCIPKLSHWIDLLIFFQIVLNTYCIVHWTPCVWLIIQVLQGPLRGTDLGLLATSDAILERLPPSVRGKAEVTVVFNLQALSVR